METMEDINTQCFKLNATNTDDTTIFKLQFEIRNPRYDLRNSIGFKLYRLIGELNKDTIEQIFIDNYDANSSSVTCGNVFKQFGKEIGLSQKYIFSKIEKKMDGDNMFIFVSNQIEKPDNVDVPVGAESVINSSSTLIITLHTPHFASVTCNFSLELEEDMPTYMENVPVLLMKKLFARLKIFLESIN